MADPTQEAHNKGEQDASDHWLGDRDPIDFMDTRYDPPSDPDLKEAYDQGWHNTESQIF